MKSVSLFFVVFLTCLFNFFVCPAQQKKANPTKKITADDTTLVNQKNIFHKDDQKKSASRQSDTTIIPLQIAFSIDPQSHQAKIIKIDTTPKYFRDEYPFQRGDKIGAMYLGALGSATAYYNYFDRPQNLDFIFAAPYIPYFFDRNSSRHYISTTPYALLFYSWAGSTPNQEEVLHASYAQSVSNKLSFGANYSTYGTRPLYTRHSARTRAVNVFVSYFSKYYNIHSGYIFNSIRNRENGGIKDDNIFLENKFDPQNYEIRIPDANNYLATQTLYFSHSLNLPILKIKSKNDTIEDNIITLRFGHDLELGRARKVYTDKVSDYYANNFMSKVSSLDSIGTSKIENKLFVNLHPKLPLFFENITAGIGYNRPIYYFFQPNDFITGTSDKGKYNNVYVYGNIAARYKNYFTWLADIEQHLLGYNIGDIKINAALLFGFYPKSLSKGLTLTLKGNFRSSTPNYFLQHYYTNHYKWENNFIKENEIQVSGVLNVPNYGFQVQFSQSLITNPIIFDELAQPKQLRGAVSISAITLQEHLHFKWIHLLHDVVVQYSSSPEFSLPLVSAKLCYYTEFNVVKNVLCVQFGFDLFYNTSFSGYAYNPSVGMFHTQNDVMYGNYPWFDVFLSARWYQATPFIKVEHATENLFGRNYFSAAHYPRNPFRLKFGLSWRFLD